MKKILFPMLTVCAFFVGLECALRFIPSIRSPKAAAFENIYDTELAMIPGSVNPYVYVDPDRLNRLGFRGREVDIDKPSGTYRIVCLGDSCTFGLNVEDGQTYPAQLERLLENRFTHPKFEVINGGVPGTNIYQHLLVLKRKLLKLKPDLLIVWSSPNFLKRIKEYRDLAFDPPLSWALKKPLRKLALYRHLMRWIHGGPREEAAYEILQRLRGQENPEWDHMDDLVADYLSDLKELSALSVQNGFYLAFTDYPSRDAVFALQAAETLPAPDQFGHALLTFCTDNKFIFIDLSSALASEADPSHFLDNVHLTPIGYRLVAGTILETLAAKDLWNEAAR